jgi:exonuclease SbcC
MKILAIRGENITSLKEFKIEFNEEPLKSAGLFAIWGPTGAGKSSLLDTMCLALFNRVPRLEGVGPLPVKFETPFGIIAHDDIKLMIRKGESTCRAEVDFLGIDGNEYRANWEYRQPKRAKAAPQEDFSLIRINDQQDVTENTKTNHFNKIENLIGLKYDQFTRTVFLSQGKFADFLKADENSRSELLEKITGTSIYASISVKIFEKNKIENKKLELLNEKIKLLSILPLEEVVELTTRISELENSLKKQTVVLDNLKNFSSSVVKWNKTNVELIQLKSEIDKNSISVTREKKKFDDITTDLKVFEQSLLELEPRLENVIKLDKEIAVLRQQEIDAKKSLEIVQETHSEILTQQNEANKKIENTKGKINTLEKWFEENSKHKKLSNEWGRWEKALEDCNVNLKNRKQIENTINQNSKKLFNIQEKIKQFNIDIEKLETTIGVIVRDELPNQIYQLTEEQKTIIDCKDYLALLNECKKATIENDRLAKLKNEAGALLKTVKNEYEAKDQMYNVALKASGETQESMRKELKDGEACPVCGALEHPYSQSDHSLKSLLIEQKKLKDLAQKAFAEASANAQVFLIQYNEALKKSETLSQELNDKKEPVSTLYLKVKALDEKEQQEHLKQADIKNTATQKELTEKFNQLQALDAKVKQRDQEAAEERSLSETNTRDIKAVEEEQARFDDLTEQLDQIFNETDWKEEWLSSPVEFEKKQQEFVELYLSNTKQIEGSQKIFDGAVEQKKILDQNEPKTRQEFDRCTKLAGDLKTAKNAKDLERSKIFGVKLVADVREENEKQRTLKLKAKDASFHEFQEATNMLARLDGEEKSKTDALSILDKEIVEISLSIANEGAYLFTEEWNSIDKTMYLHFKSIADETFIHLEKRVEKDDNIKVELKSKIKKNEDAKIESQEILKLIAEQKPIQEKWSKLSSEIGSADGKTFRKIAQSYTLETLLHFSNTQLSQITKRFQLKKKGDGGNFSIVDHDNYGDERPVHTLSGGETFMVSLALALGLSSMSSNGIVIESLFIDEGFGTLDSETLKSVMNALSQLQAQGRKVGLITHVEEMKEQIPARIEVAKSGMGSSFVKVTG